MDASANWQSEELDRSIPKLLAAMHDTKEVCAKIAGPLATEAASLPLTPRAEGLARDDLAKLSALVHAAVAANPRYGHDGEAGPRPVVATMPRSGIVRVELTYPAPPASKNVEPGPLRIDVWVCPDRHAALALFWLRRWGLDRLDSRTPETAASSVLKAGPYFTTTKAGEGEPGESAYWDFPRMIISIILPKGHRPLPADRFSFLRGNLVIEASTIEFTWNEQDKEWLAFRLRECVRDVESVMRSVDAGLVRLVKAGEPNSK